MVLRLLGICQADVPYERGFICAFLSGNPGFVSGIEGFYFLPIFSHGFEESSLHGIKLLIGDK